MLRSFGSGTIALALLVCGMVFAAVAGPAQNLQTRTQAFRRTLAELSPTTKIAEATISVNALAGDVDQLETGQGIGAVQPSTLARAKSGLAFNISEIPVPQGPGAFTSVASGAQPVSSGISANLSPELIVEYWDTLTSNVRLAAGTLTPGHDVPKKALPVTLTVQTAVKFGLHTGALVTVKGHLLYVTGIVTPVHPGGLFWQYDPTALQPSPNGAASDSALVGVVFADPGQLSALDAWFESTAEVTWVFPLSVGGVNADQAQSLYDGLNQLNGLAPQLPIDNSSDIALSTPLLAQVQAFLQAQAAVLAVLLLLFVSLAALGVAVILLAARMIVDRRENELVMLRARGASSRQIAALLIRSVTLVAVPAAIVGAAIAIAVVPEAGRAPGGSAELSWALVILTLVIAIAAPAVIAWWRYRQGTAAVNAARILTAETRTIRVSPRALRRIVAEVTAVSGAIAGLTVLRDEGTTGPGINWFLALAPVLVAIPAVLITLRLCPLIVRAALPIARRRAGATSYVALAISARTPLATAGPVFALVLALSLTAFAGMITSGVSSAQDSVSWRTTGADAVLTGNGPAILSPAALHAVAAVRGVQHSAPTWTTAWTTPDGQVISVIAVHPAEYATLTAATPFPAFPAGDLSVFTSSGLTTGTAPEVTLRPDLASVGLPAAVLLILTVATLAIQAYSTGSHPSRLLRAA